MAINKIRKFNLETRAVSLQEKNKPYEEISQILSEECGEAITKSSVQRFFASREREKQIAVAKSDKLKAKVVEAEINTIQECLNCIEELRGICKVAKEHGNTRDAIQAIEKIYVGLDMLNKVLGKYQTLPPMQLNFTEVNVTEAREKIARRIDSIAARFAAAEDPQ